MGFLTGAFLKIYHGKQKLQLQHRLTSITMQLARVQKQSGNMQTQLTRMKQMELNNATLLGNNYLKGQTDALGDVSSIFTKAQNGKSLTTEEQNTLTSYNIGYTKAQSQASIFTSAYKNMVETSFQEYEENQLQPLKDLEERLTVEKASIESQLKLAEQNSEAAKEMEKDGAKDFVPEYTGGG